MIPYTLFLACRNAETVFYNLNRLNKILNMHINDLYNVNVILLIFTARFSFKLILKGEENTFKLIYFIAFGSLSEQETHLHCRNSNN